MVGSVEEQGMRDNQAACHGLVEAKAGLLNLSVLNKLKVFAKYLAKRGTRYMDIIDGKYISRKESKLGK